VRLLRYVWVVTGTTSHRGVPTQGQRGGAMGLPRQATKASRGGENNTGGPATEAAATLTRHARRRGAQSNLCERDLEIVRMYGVLEHRTGVRFYFVRQREVERFQRAEPRLARLQGVVMV